MRTVPIQTSFAGGEISPKLRGRVDSELWKKGLDECINFEPLAHGPLLSRGGTKWNRSFDDFTSDCRLLEFPRQGEVGFLLAMGGGAMRVLSGLDGSQIEAGAIDWIKNPFFTYGWSYWETYLEGVVSGRRLIAAVAEAGPRGWVYQFTDTLVAGTYTFRLDASTANGNGLNIFIGTTGKASTDLLSENFGTAGLSQYSVIERTITLAAPAVVHVYIETTNQNAESVDEGAAWGAEVREVAVRATGTVDAIWDDTTTPALPWADAQLAEIQMVAEPARDRVMFFHPRVAPYELLFDRDSAAWSFGAIVFTQPTPPHWESPNFPGVAELYQGRLVVSGIPGALNKILGSKSGEPYDFTLGTDADDAFSLDISTKGAIRWIHGHRELLIGTDRGESAMIASSGRITPTDFEVRPQSGFGSATVQALHLGDLVLYVSRDRRRLRMLSFNLQENGWQTRDLTFTSEHMTGGLILDTDWLSTGNDQVLAVMRSGEVVGWTFNRAEQVVAPWRIDFGGAVYALCVLDVGDQDKAWMLVQRAGTVCLEEWLVADDPERCLLDSYEVSRPSAGVAGGYTWLVGETVVAICDGVAGDPQVVSATGTITVPVNATTCVAGIFSPRSFKTLPREGGQPGGTAQGSKQRMVKVSLRLNDSALPLVNNSRCAPDRSPETSMGEIEPRLTADVTVRVVGWEDKGAVTVTQDIPLRTEILAIFGVLATNEV